MTGLALSAVFILILAAVAVTEFFHHRLGVVTMPTMPRVREAMLALAEPPPGGHVVELGAGWGGLALAAAARWPGCRVTGVEYSPVPFRAACLRRLLRPGLSNLRFAREDFFSLSLKDADVVLCYLSLAHMARLRDKFLSELPPSARVVSSTFLIPGWRPARTETVKGLWDTVIYVYRREDAA